METTQLLATLRALHGEGPDVAEGFLMAAVYSRALATDQTPRDILDALWKAMPSADGWPGLRTALLATLDD